MDDDAQLTELSSNLGSHLRQCDRTRCKVGGKYSDQGSMPAMMLPSSMETG